MLCFQNEIQFINFHSSLHFDNHMAACRKKNPFEHFEVNHVTQCEDEFSQQYASKLTACCEEFHYDLKFTYRTAYECEYFHGPTTALMSNNTQYNSVEKLLKGEFPKDSVLGYSTKPISFSHLFNRIMDDDPHFSGFIALKGGKENIEDVAKKCQGFTLVKTNPKFDQLGPMALNIICKGGQLSEKKGEEKLKQMCSRSKLTIAKQGLESEEIVVWNTGLFRWMVKNRKFEGYKIIHFVRYSKRNYLRPWLESFLQTRHIVKKQKDTSLQSATLKLIINR